MSDVVILGAGFSHAADERFPLMTKLAGPVVERLRGQNQNSKIVEDLLSQVAIEEDGNVHLGQDLETWLSRLAEDQPHLSHAENLERQSLFVRARQSIWEVLTSVQHKVFSEKSPDWVFDLVSVLHTRRTTVITLNYDNVIEHTVGWSDLWDHGPQQGASAPGRPVREDDLLLGIPPLYQIPEAPINSQPVFGAVFASGDSPVYTLQLLKLHGSLSWFSVPTDPTGITLQAWNPLAYGDLLDVDKRRRDLPGREPFLVPPASLKSSYFQSPVVREIWRRAYESLSGASRVILIGYSLPHADVTFAGMLADAIGNRSVEIIVVNPCPQPVIDELVMIGVDSKQIRPVSDDVSGIHGQPVMAWVRSEIDEQAKHAVALFKKALESNARTERSVVAQVGWIGLSTQKLLHSNPIKSGGTLNSETGELVLDLQTSPERRLLEKREIEELASNLDRAQIMMADIGGRRRVIIDCRYEALLLPEIQYKGTFQINLIPVGAPPRLLDS